MAICSGPSLLSTLQKTYAKSISPTTKTKHSNRMRSFLQLTPKYQISTESQQSLTLVLSTALKKLFMCQEIKDTIFQKRVQTLFAYSTLHFNYQTICKYLKILITLLQWILHLIKLIWYSAQYLKTVHIFAILKIQGTLKPAINASIKSLPTIIEFNIFHFISIGPFFLKQDS